MAFGYSLDDRAESFASQFPQEDREGVREWYLAKLKEEHHKARRKKLRAWAVVVFLAVLMPALALWAFRLMW